MPDYYYNNSRSKKCIFICLLKDDGHHFHVGEVSTNTIIKSIKYVHKKHLKKSLTLSSDGTLVYAGYKVGGKKDEDGAAFKPYKVYDNFSHGSNTVLGDYNKPSKPEMVAESELTDDYTVIYLSVVDHGNYLYEIIRQTSVNTFSVMTRLDISSFTGFFALSSDNNYIATVNSNGSITYIDTETFSVLETFDVVTNPKVLLLLDSN